MELGDFKVSPIVNPIGHGMLLCLTAMKDCKKDGDMEGHQKWLDLGLKYVDLQVEYDTCGLPFSTITHWHSGLVV